MFPFQEECFNPPFPLFVTRRVMTPSTLFPRHAFQFRLCLPPPKPSCAFVYLKIRHQSAIRRNGPPILHRMTGPPTLKPSLRNQKFHSSGLPHHNECIDQRNKTNRKKKKPSVRGCSGIGTRKTKKTKLIFFYLYLFCVVSCFLIHIVIQTSK